VTPAQVAVLRCPACAAPLEYVGPTAFGHLHCGNLKCAKCEIDWPVEEGLPRLVPQSSSRGFEAVIHLIYELIAPIHDLGVRYGLPMAMLATEDDVRSGYLRRLDLESLATGNGDRPVRILDVGIGAGGNLPYLEWGLPRGLHDVELWGVDYSTAMLAQCRRRLLGRHGPPVSLLHADAHALPFADGTFDRVLHVGAIASYRDPALALREMCRVACPGSPVVVVDEQLDPAAGWYQQMMFHWITVFDRVKRAPVEHVPRGVSDVQVSQVSPFYYCLSFRAPA
jgi:SAM-dependent methyltransferase